jgi:hypothetical protein
VVTHLKGIRSIALLQFSEFKTSESLRIAAVEDGLGSYHATLV